MVVGDFGLEIAVIQLHFKDIKHTPPKLEPRGRGAALGGEG